LRDSVTAIGDAGPVGSRKNLAVLAYGLGGEQTAFND